MLDIPRHGRWNGDKINAATRRAAPRRPMRSVAWSACT